MNGTKGKMPSFKALIPGAAAVILAIALLMAAGYLLWRSGVFLPRWILWEEGAFNASPGGYEIRLKHKEVNIIYEGEILWTSPKEAKVQSALSSDIDGDGEEELVLLCWKRGRYGSHRPFWVKKDEPGWFQHIFVYEYVKENAVDGDMLRPKWMSSYIGQDVVRMDAEAHSKGPVHLLLTDPEGRISSWVWDSWGFSREDTEVSLVAFGDNLVHESIYTYGLHNNDSFEFLYQNVRDIVAEKDIAIINQETPLVEDPVRYSGYPRFGTPMGVGQAMAEAGFDVVTCATNHALDQGAYGIDCTSHFFDSHQILCLGIQSSKETAYRPYELLVKKGIRFALLNYTYGTNGIKIPEENPAMVHLLRDEAKIREDIKKAKVEADIVLLFVHWGTEDSLQTDDFQRKWTAVFLDEKVDVVVGTHPHVLQPYEVLEGAEGHKMLVYYSLGNFISAQPEQECCKGGMAEFTVSRTSEGYKVTEYALKPLKIIRKEGLYTTIP